MSEEKQQPSEMEIDEDNAAASGSSAQEATMEVAQLETADARVVDEPVDEAVAGQSSSSSARVMASSGTVGSVSISLHPLVIMNVSEHWTRLRAQEGKDQLG